MGVLLEEDRVYMMCQLQYKDEPAALYSTFTSIYLYGTPHCRPVSSYGATAKFVNCVQLCKSEKGVHITLLICFKPATVHLRDHGRYLQTRGDIDAVG